MDVYDNAKFLGKGSKQDGTKLSRKEKAAKSIANVKYDIHKHSSCINCVLLQGYINLR